MVDLPHDRIVAPQPIAADLADVSPGADVISISRNTKGLFRLPEYRNLRRVWTTGLDAQTLTVVSSLPELRELVVYEYRERDLTAVARATALESLAVWYAPRLRSLAGVEHLRGLRELIVGDVRGPLPLDEVASLASLETMSMEGGMWRPLAVPSLQPLASLERVERLRIASIKVEDQSLAPLRGLSRVRDVFIANQFPLEEFARLAAAWPEVKSESLHPVRPAGIECGKCRGKRTVLLTGGRGLKCDTCDAPAIDRHIARFERELKSTHVVRTR